MRGLWRSFGEGVDDHGIKKDGGMSGMCDEEFGWKRMNDS